MEDSLSNWRFCCVVSKANGEDPIGSAPTYEHCLALEMQLPWTEKRWHENPLLQSAMTLIQKLIFEHRIGNQLPLEEVKQYRVRHLVKVA
ncbi:hypothetical protein [Nostoc sp.]|uniref:hypothetical protein n=1 Tax=Nostoc sp. TaxID=1180 RepID=UPI002FFCD6BE